MPHILERVLVTGGTGFIGRHLVRALLARDPAVAVTTASRGPAGPAADPRCRHVVADVADLPALERAAQGVDTIFHLAALAAVPDILEDPTAGFVTNVTGTFHVLEAARRRGVARLVFVSSGRVVGDAAGSPVLESAALAPKEPYGAQKAAGEVFCHAYARSYGLATVVVRPFVVYGPGQRTRPGSRAGVIPRFASQVLSGEPVTVVGDGRQRSDFVHVRDLVEALLRAAVADGAPGEVFHVGSGRPTSIRRLVDLVGEAAGIVPTVRPLPPGKDTISVYPSVEKAERMLGWKPAVTLEEGLRDYVAWLRDAGHRPDAG